MGVAADQKEPRRLQRQFDRIGRQVPASAGFLHWIRQPSSRWIRIPLGVLLVLGGIFSILPLLGIWMLPLGLLLLALDLPFLQGPINHGIIWLQRSWTRLKRRWRKKD